MQLYSRNSIVSSLYSQYTPITSPVYLQLFSRMSHPTPILAVGIPGLYPHICYGHNLESCADIGSIYGDYIYIYPYLMVRSLSHYIKWYPHMISYFVYTVWIYIYIHKYIYIYIYIWWVIYLYHGELWHYYGFLWGFEPRPRRGSWLSTESATRKAACEQLQKVPRWEKSHGTLRVMVNGG